MSYFSFWRRFSYNPSQTYALGAQKPPSAHVIEPVKFWIFELWIYFCNTFQISRVQLTLKPVLHSGARRVPISYFLSFSEQWGPSSVTFGSGDRFSRSILFSSSSTCSISSAGVSLNKKIFYSKKKMHFLKFLRQLILDRPVGSTTDFRNSSLLK